MKYDKLLNKVGIYYAITTSLFIALYLLYYLLVKNDFAFAFLGIIVFIGLSTFVLLFPIQVVFGIYLTFRRDFFWGLLNTLLGFILFGFLIWAAQTYM